MPEEDHPYREAPAIAPAERLPVRRGAYVAAVVVGGVAAGVTAVLGGPIEWIGGIGLAAGAQALTLLALRSRRRALAAVAQLPFPVRHEPELVIERNPPRSIQEVRIVLVTILDDHDAERAGKDIVARVPGLVAAIEDDRFILTRWPLADDHMAKLRDVLATWGRELHDRHGIREVVVTWVYGSPA